MIAFKRKNGVFGPDAIAIFPLYLKLGRDIFGRHKIPIYCCIYRLLSISSPDFLYTFELRGAFTVYLAVAVLRPIVSTNSCSPPLGVYVMSFSFDILPSTCARLR